MSATNPKRTYRSIVNLMLSAAPRAHSSVSDLGAPLNEERLSGPAEGSSLGYLASWPSRDLSGKVSKRYDAHSSRSESVRVAAFLLKHIEAEVS
jgi:hypothetical protein